MAYDTQGNQIDYSDDPDYYIDEDQEDEWIDRVVGAKDLPMESIGSRRDNAPAKDDSRLLIQLRESSSVWYIDGAVPEELKVSLESALGGRYKI